MLKNILLCAALMFCVNESAHAILLPTDNAVLIDLTTAEATDVRGHIRSLTPTTLSVDSHFLGDTNIRAAGTRLLFRDIVIPEGATYLMWEIEAQYSGLRNLGGFSALASCPVFNDCYTVRNTRHGFATQAIALSPFPGSLRLEIGIGAPNLPDLFFFAATLSNLRFESYASLDPQYLEDLPASVPEPGSLALLGIALAGLTLSGRRKKQ